MRCKQHGETNNYSGASDKLRQVVPVAGPNRDSSLRCGPGPRWLHTAPTGNNCEEFNDSLEAGVPETKPAPMASTQGSSHLRRGHPFIRHPNQRQHGGHVGCRAPADGPTTRQAGRTANRAPGPTAHVTTEVTGSMPQAGLRGAFAARQVRRCHSSQRSPVGRTETSRKPRKPTRSMPDPTSSILPWKPW